MAYPGDKVRAGFLYYKLTANRKIILANYFNNTPISFFLVVPLILMFELSINEGIGQTKNILITSRHHN